MTEEKVNTDRYYTNEYLHIDDLSKVMFGDLINALTTEYF